MRALKCSRVEVEAKITAAVPTWLNRAADRTRANLSAGKVTSDSPDWSEIKAILLEEQHGLCAYCETKLSLEQSEIDHFRPKQGKEASRSNHQNYNNSAGYYWLSHDIGNYCVSCHDCNSIHKKTNFPIRGNRAPVGTVPELMGSEEPALINPLWDWEDDPADHIGFDGATVKLLGIGSVNNRARIINQVFKLNERESLVSGRITQIAYFHQQIKNFPDLLDHDPEALITPGAAHRSCVIAYLSLYRSDPTRAEEFGELAKEIVFKDTIRLPTSDHRAAVQAGSGVASTADSADSASSATR